LLAVALKDYEARQFPRTEHCIDEPPSEIGGVPKPVADGGEDEPCCCL
jgi:hypothetical protein